MLHSFRLKTPEAAGLAALLLASLLVGCSRTETPPPPVLSTWAEQSAAVESAIRAKGGDLELTLGKAIPVRQKQGAPDEPVELRVYFWYASPKSSGVGGDGQPLYPMRMVKYNDHRLATTLRVESDAEAAETNYPPPPKSGERARLMRLSPQDILRLTRVEGEAHMGEPVDHGNITIDLVRVNEIPPDVSALAVWRIEYYGKEKILSFLVDAQTGAILKRSTEERTKDRPEAARSPGS